MTWNFGKAYRPPTSNVTPSGTITVATSDGCTHNLRFEPNGMSWLCSPTAELHHHGHPLTNATAITVRGVGARRDVPEIEDGEGADQPLDCGRDGLDGSLGVALTRVSERRRKKGPFFMPVTPWSRRTGSRPASLAETRGAFLRRCRRGSPAAAGPSLWHSSSVRR